jgi:thiol-disulfide isomerase/thioredoxin
MSARLPAPELPGTLSWVNAREKPSLAKLRGRVVLLHFWAYSNANCLNVLPDLRYLENKYHDGLTVLSVHCPKFAAERTEANLVKAVNRHYVRHPVAHDLDFLCWQLYGIRAWPTVAVIDPDGALVRVMLGEGRRIELDALVGSLLDEAASRDARVYESVQAVTRPEPKMPLRFPGKVLATDTALFVADSGHNRILECAHDGRIVRQFGSGNPGFWDGRGTDAGFSNPQGMAMIKDILYVADSGNHAIRRVRLINGEVDTIAGTGLQGHSVVSDAAEPQTVALNGPCALAATTDRLFIALSGQRQIWQLDMVRMRLGVLAGSGRHGSVDGPAGQAGFAQPAGLACHGQMLYIADADASSVRALRLNDFVVRSLVGVGPYEFGDVDGLPDKARLQYPTSIAVDPGGSILWVADTYNNKIKALSLRGGGVRTLALPYRFHEPTGISVAAKCLWIANTGAHEIVRIDTGTGSIKRLPIGE